MDEDGGGGDGRGEEQEAAAEQLMEKEAADNSLGLFYSFLLFRHLFGAFFIRFVV